MLGEAWSRVTLRPAEERTELDIVAVCRANMARSPLLSVALQHEADLRLGDGVIAVGSAGVDAHQGAPAAAGSRRVAETWGLSLEGHRTTSTRFVPLDGALLVVTMTRRQRGIVAREHPDLGCRTFTMREAVAAFEVPDAGREAEGTGDVRERVRAAVTAAHRTRPATRWRRRFDVPDPLGGDDRVYESLGREIREAATRLADVLFGTPQR